jgi:hypothetical protein
MIRRLALLLTRHAAQVLRAAGAPQAQAMLAELEYIHGWDALAWGFGCVLASYRQRAGVLAVAIVTAQLSVGLAAAVFGLLHI